MASRINIYSKQHAAYYLFFSPQDISEFVTSVDAKEEFSVSDCTKTADSTTGKFLSETTA